MPNEEFAVEIHVLRGTFMPRTFQEKCPSPDCDGIVKASKQNCHCVGISSAVLGANEKRIYFLVSLGS